MFLSKPNAGQSYQGPKFYNSLDSDLVSANSITSVTLEEFRGHFLKI